MGFSLKKLPFELTMCFQTQWGSKFWMFKIWKRLKTRIILTRFLNGSKWPYHFQTGQNNPVFRCHLRNGPVVWLLFYYLAPCKMTPTWRHDACCSLLGTREQLPVWSESDWKREVRRGEKEHWPLDEIWICKAKVKGRISCTLHLSMSKTN